MVDEREVIDKLRNCIDPELGINIVDLGLIYGISIDQEKGEVAPYHFFYRQHGFHTLSLLLETTWGLWGVHPISRESPSEHCSR